MDTFIGLVVGMFLGVGIGLFWGWFNQRLVHHLVRGTVFKLRAEVVLLSQEVADHLRSLGKRHDSPRPTSETARFQV
jgi:hypothetical protein